MWIMGQNERSLFNAERFGGIHIYNADKGFYITGIDKETGSEIELALYSSEQKAKSVLVELMTNIEKVRFIMPPDESQGEPTD
jgi:hypothetical protein